MFSPYAAVRAIGLNSTGDRQTVPVAPVIVTLHAGYYSIPSLQTIGGNIL